MKLDMGYYRHPYTVTGIVDRPNGHFPNGRCVEHFSCSSQTKDRRIIRRDLRKWYGTPLRIFNLKIVKTKGTQS